MSRAGQDATLPITVFDPHRQRCARSGGRPGPPPQKPGPPPSRSADRVPKANTFGESLLSERTAVTSGSVPEVSSGYPLPIMCTPTICWPVRKMDVLRSLSSSRRRGGLNTAHSPASKNAASIKTAMKRGLTAIMPSPGSSSDRPSTHPAWGTTRGTTPGRRNSATRAYSVLPHVGEGCRRGGRRCGSSRPTVCSRAGRLSRAALEPSNQFLQ